jgi:hypothetical protein
MKLVRNLAVMVLVVSMGIVVSAQWKENPKTGSPQQRLEDRTNMAGMTGMVPMLKASFVHRSKNFPQRQAVVQAEVWGVNLVPPGSSNEPSLGKAYLAYVLDHYPVHKTDQKTYTFSDIPLGRHTISVQLMALNNQPIGERRILGFVIPK